jgi:hypothetical protein
MSFKT